MNSQSTGKRRRLRLTLRTKLLVFAIAIAVLPILVAARTMIRIGEDELKSSANEQLLGVASELSREINDVAERSWFGPLVLIRNAIDDPRLGVNEKVALLTLGIANLADIVALQITLDGADLPLVVTNDEFSDKLRRAGLDPLEVLRIAPDEVRALRATGDVFAEDAAHLPETDSWLATVVLPLGSKIAGADAVLSARIDLQRLRHIIFGHPFVKTGILTVVDRHGREVFDAKRRDLSSYPIVAEAVERLASQTRSIGVAPHKRPNGEVMLGAYAFPRVFNWALLAELPQRDAYLAIVKMTRSLLLWGAIGLAVAVLGATLLAIRISHPMLEIGRVAVAVARGDFGVRVRRGTRRNDEIGDLARRMNEMVVGLSERFHLEKFVSGGTMAAIRGSGQESMQLGGGMRRRATMLFADIRGYTSFAEQHEPHLVIEVLNFYFQHLTALVKEHRGDIDKFVGDQIVAVFHDAGAETNAVRCALAIQAKMQALSADRPAWNLAIGVGVNTGDIVMGAMGSRERMDYTVLGDAVNMAARLCSSAERGQILIGPATRAALEGHAEFQLRPLAPIQLKGKRQLVQVYELRAAEELPLAAGA